MIKTKRNNQTKVKPDGMKTTNRASETGRVS